MSFLSQVQTSTPNVGLRSVIVGAEKIGKTTFGAGAPDVLLIPLEQGYAGIKVPHTPMITTYTDMLGLMNEIKVQAQQGQFKYRTILIDSATALEKLMHAYTIALDPSMKGKPPSMEVAHGGYGKAYGVANNLFNEFLAWCDLLAINARINFVITAHAFAAKVKDPLNGEYDSWDILLHSPKDQKTYGKREIITQWADVVGYLHDPMNIMKSDGVSKGISSGQGRVLGVERTPAYTAGNRFRMRGTIAIPPPADPVSGKEINGWNYFAHALYTAAGIDLYDRTRP